MKRLILLFCILTALAAPAWATDVTISSLSVDGANFTNIGNDRSIAVTTISSNTLVTSAGLFPSAIVGLGGFTVLIDGAQYTVASVASTSSLTLTANYAGTPGSVTMTLYKYVIMRAYVDRAFQPLGGTAIIQPGTVGSGNFYRQFAASVVNNGSTNQLLIPQIILPATTDALITNQARYSFQFYTPGGARLEFFLCPSSLAQLRLPPATPTTWSAICTFNSPPAVVPPANEAYTKSAIDARFPSCSLNNGLYYSAAGNVLSCLTFGSGLSVSGGTLTASAGGSGYNRIQEEGSNLTQRATLNFIGTSVTCVDNAGQTRTDCTTDSDLDAIASFAGTGFAARTGAGTWATRTLTAPAAGFTITNPAGVAGNPTFVLADDLNAVEGLSTNGIATRTAASTWTTRTITGTANEITSTNGDGVAGNPTLSLPAALTFTGKTVTNGTFTTPTINSGTLATPTITTPTITGGTHTALTSLGIRSTGSGAFDLTLNNTENLTAGRTLTLTLNDANRTVNLGGNLTTGGSFTTTGTFSSGGNFSTGAAFTTTPANALTLTTTGSTNVTLPTSGTLATLAGTETFTNKTLTSPRIGTSILDTNGNPFVALTASGSAVNGFTWTNGAAAVGPILGSQDASGSNTAGVRLDLAGGKGTGTGIPGGVAIRYPLITSSGSTLQSLSSTSNVYLPLTSLYTNTSTGTAINNTTTETSLFATPTASAGSTTTIEGGISRAGTNYKVRIVGNIQTTGSPTLQVRGKLGSTTIVDTTASAITTAGGKFWLDIDILVTAIGASGTVTAYARFDLSSAASGGATIATLNASAAGTTIDFTANQTLDVTIQWGTANASNSIQVFEITVTRAR